MPELESTRQIARNNDCGQQRVPCCITMDSFEIEQSSLFPLLILAKGISCVCMGRHRRYPHSAETAGVRHSDRSSIEEFKAVEIESGFRLFKAVAGQ